MTIGRELQNQFHPIVAHTNKNWPYFVQLGTVARSRVCLGSKWGRWQSKPWVTTPFDAIFVKFMHTPSFFSFQTGAVKGVDRFTISRFQLLLNSKIHGNNRGPFRTENQDWASNPYFYFDDWLLMLDMIFQTYHWNFKIVIGIIWFSKIFIS